MTHIKHIWFDMEGTLTIYTPEWEAAHDQLLLNTYADVMSSQPSPELWKEYSEIYNQQGTHSAAFRSLGLPSDFWQQHFAQLDEEKYYKPDERVYGTLSKLKELVPISIFTNAKPERLAKTLAVINIDPSWFTFTLTGDDISERKPALHGFQRLLELSKLHPQNVLYVGDRVKADIEPAKSLGLQAGLVWSRDSAADYSFDDITEILDLFK